MVQGLGRFAHAGRFVLAVVVISAALAPPALAASAQLTWQNAPADTVAGRTILTSGAAALQVKALDSNGAAVSGVSVTVSYTGTGLTGTTTQVTNGSGIATFSNLRTTTRTTQANKRFEATATGYNQGNSSNFTSAVNVAPVLPTVGNKSVSENALLSFTVSATDATSGTTLTYAATNLPSGASLHSGTGVFSWTPTYSQSGVYPGIVISVSDEIGSVSETIQITVSNENRAPTVNAAGPFSVPENSANATTVGTAVTATDPDTGETATLAFSITAGNTGSAFAIGSSTGQITVATSAALDYETTPSFSLTIRATDVLGAFDTEVVTVNLTNVNEGPTVNAAGPFSLAENSANGTAVGAVTASDPDAGQTATLAFSISGGNTATAFAIDSGTGAITVNDSAALDYETTTSWTLVIRATDAGGAFDEENVTVNLTSVNETPTVNPAGPFSLDENSPDDTVAGTVTASDPDAGHSVTFSITGGNTGGAFEIGETSGQIVVDTRAALDYESNPTFTLTVRATSNGGLTDEEDIVVNLNDVNEGPTLNAAGPFSVAENSANGTSVGTMTASDPEDAPPESLSRKKGPSLHTVAGLTFSITAGNTGSVFAIDGTSGEITVGDNSALDYEENPSFALTVRVTDAGGLWDEESVTVDLNDVNEGPTLNAAGPFSLDEDSASGTSVGTMTATDPEDAPPSSLSRKGGSSIHVAAGLTFSITAGNTGGAFAIGSSSGEITVDDNTALDYETTPTFTLTVRVTDTGGLWDEETVTVGLTNVNEGPTVNAAGPFSVAEGSADGASVGTVSASDPDSGDTASLSFSITGGNTGGAFAVGGSTGAITVDGDLDYETTPSYTLTIRATDTSGAWDEEDVTVNVTNANEAPAVDAAGPFSLAENSASGTAVGTVSASDPDDGETATLTFSITGGNTGSAFAIASGSGAITVNTASALDFEATPSFTLTVRATDANSSWDEETVVVDLTDEDEAPAASNATFNVSESSPDGTVVGTVPASDPDDGDTLTYEITAGNGDGTFAIDSDSGQITVANSANLDGLATPSYELTVTVTDGTDLTDTCTITVNVTVPGAGTPHTVTFGIYNQGRNSSLPSHVRAVLSDYPPSAEHDLGDGKDVELEVELLSGSCEGEGCTPLVESGQAAQYSAQFEVVHGSFGRHSAAGAGNNAVAREDGTFSLEANGGSTGRVSFLFGRYLLIQADVDDEAGQGLDRLKANDRQGVLVPVVAPAFGDLTHLSATFQSVAGGDGTPHLDVYLSGHGRIRVRLGNSPGFNDTDAAMNDYSNVNVIGNDDAGRYDTSAVTNVGGATSSWTTYTDALALAGEFVIEKIEFVADDDGTTGSREYELEKINVMATSVD